MARNAKKAAKKPTKKSARKPSLHNQFESGIGAARRSIADAHGLVLRKKFDKAQASLAEAEKVLPSVRSMLTQLRKQYVAFRARSVRPSG